MPVLHVWPSQHGCPMPPQAWQRAFVPNPEQLVPGCEQNRGTLVCPISQQICPRPPQVIAPMVQLPLALQVPAVPPHMAPAATQT